MLTIRIHISGCIDGAFVALNSWEDQWDLCCGSKVKMQQVFSENIHDTVVVAVATDFKLPYPKTQCKARE